MPRASWPRVPWLASTRCQPARALAGHVCLVPGMHRRRVRQQEGRHPNPDHEPNPNLTLITGVYGSKRIVTLTLTMNLTLT
eukprot:scaffold13377_cov61-Phaeocystis_antarctica.AAC.10